MYLPFHKPRHGRWSNAVSHYVGFMYLGRIRKRWAPGAGVRKPAGTYTQSLDDAVPIADPLAAKRKANWNFKPIPSPNHRTTYGREPLFTKPVSGGPKVLEFTDSDTKDLIEDCAHEPV